MKRLYLPIGIRDINHFLTTTEEPINTAVNKQAGLLINGESGLDFASTLYQAQAMLQDDTRTPPAMSISGVGQTLSERLTQPPAGVIFEVEIPDEVANRMQKAYRPLIGEVYKGEFNPQTILHIYSQVGADKLNDPFYATEDVSLPPMYNNLYRELSRRLPSLNRLAEEINFTPDEDLRKISLDSLGIKQTFSPQGFVNASDESLSFGNRMCRNTMQVMVEDVPPFVGDVLIIANEMDNFLAAFRRNLMATSANDSNFPFIRDDADHAEDIANSLVNAIETIKPNLPNRFSDPLTKLQEDIPAYVAREASPPEIDTGEIEDECR